MKEKDVRRRGEVGDRASAGTSVEVRLGSVIIESVFRNEGLRDLNVRFSS